MSARELERRRQRMFAGTMAGAEAAERERLDLVRRAYEMGRLGLMERVWFDGPAIYVTADPAIGWWARRCLTWKRLRLLVEAAEKRFLARRPMGRETGPVAAARRSG